MKVLIIDDVAKLLISGLTNLGYEVKYVPEISRAELLKIVFEYHILIVRTKTPIDKEVLLLAKSLKIIARAGSGLDNINIEFATQLNIKCINAGEANADAVGEHTLGVLLSLMRNINKANMQVKNKIWQREENRGLELNNKTVGIIGFGNTGKAFAKKLFGFETKVLAYDKYLINYANDYARESSLNQIFDQVDILSLHIPLTSETKNWINGKFIKKFRKNIFLLNMCRGEVVNTTQLIENIDNGKIVGAGLDVLENEKLNTLSNLQQKEFDYLSNCENVILTPHIAGWTVESYEKIAQIMLLKLTNLKLG